jgi:hypothetical protein
MIRRAVFRIKIASVVLFFLKKINMPTKPSTMLKPAIIATSADTSTILHTTLL